MDYTSIVGSVNKAARLQSLNKEFNSTLILSEHFFKHLDNQMKATFEQEVTAIRGYNKEKNIFI